MRESPDVSVRQIAADLGIEATVPGPRLHKLRREQAATGRQISLSPSGGSVLVQLNEIQH